MENQAVMIDIGSVKSLDRSTKVNTVAEVLFSLEAISSIPFLSTWIESAVGAPFQDDMIQVIIDSNRKGHINMKDMAEGSAFCRMVDYLVTYNPVITCSDEDGGIYRATVIPWRLVPDQSKVGRVVRITRGDDGINIELSDHSRSKEPLSKQEAYNIREAIRTKDKSEFPIMMSLNAVEAKAPMVVIERAETEGIGATSIEVSNCCLYDIYDAAIFVGSGDDHKHDIRRDYDA